MTVTTVAAVGGLSEGLSFFRAVLALTLFFLDLLIPVAFFRSFVRSADVSL